MRTYPILKDDGSLRGFEIRAQLTVFPLLRLLRSVDGVSDVRHNWSNADRISFTFHGRPAVVHEPWGDSSRYWIGLQHPDSAPDIDITPIHEAFKHYRGFLVTILWPLG